MAIPLKQGLKPLFPFLITVRSWVDMAIPLKQGLKLYLSKPV